MNLTPIPLDKIKLKKTEGYWLYDQSGERYLDITSGGATFPLGYGNERIARAVYESLLKVSRCHTPLGYTTDEIEEMSDFLCKSGDWAGYVWATTGTGSVEAAIEISDAYWKSLGENKPYIVSFGKGWHGTSYLTKPMSGLYPHDGTRTILLDTPIWKNGSEQVIEEERCLNDLKLLLESNPNIGSVIINPSPWFNGVNIWSYHFFKELDKLRTKFKFLIISDDIASCWGKSKAFHSHTTIYPEGIKPNISCLGKAITGGYAPLSATVVDNQVKELTAGKIYYGHTFQPYVGGIAAMKATTEIILEEDLINYAQIIENNLSEIGEKLIKDGYIKSFRAFGLNVAYDIDNEINLNNLNLTGIRARHYGLSKKYSALPVMRIMAPLIADEEYFVHLETLLRNILK
jgi:adenosylmethionine-8-amino-7-oxononanoate aminotransferase